MRIISASAFVHWETMADEKKTSTTPKTTQKMVDQSIEVFIASLKRSNLPTHYFIDSEDGLELPSIILMEQLRTIDKHRLGKYIGHLRKQHIDGMNRALAVSIHLNPKQNHSITMCLCGTCADNFRSTGAYILRKDTSCQVEKDTCTYCNQRTGYDFEIIPKNI